jgi:hypothetical protein
LEFDDLFLQAAAGLVIHSVHGALLSLLCALWAQQGSERAAARNLARSEQCHSLLFVFCPRP